MTLPVPIALPLQHIRGVELMHAGTWNASTGQHTFTLDDFRNAVAALDCPSVRRPILKLGHTDPRFDGQPAAGYIDNLTVNDSGAVLLGDYVGMPGWMTPEVLASAYPDRSVEGQWDYQCAIGHTHPFVLTAVALLGVVEPAIGTLTSLQDVAALYGVQDPPNVAASHNVSDRFAVHLKGPPVMPNPRPTTVAAGVNAEDVRRAYYESAPWSEWITEIQLVPLQLIVMDDNDGTLTRVPITIAGDGADGVQFGTPVPVVVRYDDIAAPATAAPDATDPVPVAASRIVFASRSESRPGSPAKATTAPAALAGATLEGGSLVALTLTDEQESALREALGLADDADGDAIVAAVEELATAPSDDAATTDTQVAARRNLPDGVTPVDSDVLAGLQRDAALGRQAMERQQREDRERVVDAALGRGAITPARRDHWLTLMSKDPEGTETLLKGLPDELAVPLSELGHSIDRTAALSTENVRESDVYKNWSM